MLAATVTQAAATPTAAVVVTTLAATEMATATAEAADVVHFPYMRFWMPYYILVAGLRDAAAAVMTTVLPRC